MEKEKKRYNTIEKISFTLGAIILLSLVSFLIFRMSQKEKTPPNLEINIAEDTSTPEYDFKVIVENVGEVTAEAANITIRLYQKGKAAEDGSINIQYAPANSKRTAWIVFPQKKEAGDSVAVASITYVKP